MHLHAPAHTRSDAYVLIGQKNSRPMLQNVHTKLNRIPGERKTCVHMQLAILTLQTSRYTVYITIAIILMREREQGNPERDRANRLNQNIPATRAVSISSTHDDLYILHSNNTIRIPSVHKISQQSSNALHILAHAPDALRGYSENAIFSSA